MSRSSSAEPARHRPHEAEQHKTLDEIASEQDVSSDDLLSALKSDLKSNKPAGAPELGDDLLRQIATDIAAGKRPGGPRDAGGPPTRANGAGDVTATGTNLKSLAETLGLSESDLCRDHSSTQPRQSARLGAIARDGRCAARTRDLLLVRQAL